VHDPHVPLLHTLFVPQVVPLATLPVSAHTDAPVTHDVAPVLHTLVGWQLTPPVHETQLPVLQTLFVPQVVPLARLLPVSEQLIEGEQTVMPAWQAFAGAQARPAVQATHTPVLHTMFVPHIVPLATLPVSVHTGAPLVQTVAAVRQGLPLTVQLAPAVQETQLPEALQTLFVPQLVPAATSVVLSLQTGVPVEQESVPWWQAFVGTQAAPSWQVPHVPERHTIPVPHEVPFGWFPDAVQTGAPVVHAIAPTWHGSAVSEQALPAVQATQDPLPHTIPCPHTVPFACGCWVSVQDATPVAEHAVCPTWHGLVTVQGLPDVHPLVPPSPVVPAAPVVPPPLSPATPSVPAVPPRPPAPVPPSPLEPPRPATASVPPVPDPPSGTKGSTRSPQPNPPHPSNIDTSTTFLSISSP
jgi:hypothetical protein